MMSDEEFRDFNAPAFGIGDIVTSRRNKRVGIVKDYQVNEEKTDYDYFIAWLAEYNEREKMRARDLRRY